MCLFFYIFHGLWCCNFWIFFFVKAHREKENALEALADRELTIVKFRELVQKLQDQCQELQIQLQKESVNNDSMKMSIPEMLDFKVRNVLYRQQ